MPLTPMGCEVSLHNKPDIKKTWDDHSIDGFYIATSREHYLFFKTWVKNTRSISVWHSVFQTPIHNNARSNKTDVIITTANQLIKVLPNKILANIGDTDASVNDNLLTLSFSPLPASPHHGWQHFAEAAVLLQFFLFICIFGSSLHVNHGGQV